MDPTPILREIAGEDLTEINAWRNNPNIVSGLAAPFRPINLATDEEWFRQYQQNRSTQLRLCLFVPPRTAAVGMVSLTHIDLIHRKAEIHLLIGAEDHHHRGFGTFALQNMLRHAFLNLNLHRVELQVLENNPWAIRLYERAGFCREGLLREAVFKDGAYRSLVQMALFRREYR